MKNKIILITGASSGFGWLIAKSCASHGHKVYATMRNTKGANTEKAKALAQHENIAILDMDVSNAKSVTDAVTTIINKEGSIDVLVNNAGIYPTGIAETFTDKDLEKVIDVNVTGAWRAIKAVLPQMRKQGSGLIINISSIAGRFAPPFQAMYNASKFALEGLTETLHYEVKSLGVDVVLVQPGAFPTEIWGKIMSGTDAEVIEEYGDLAKVPEQMGAGVKQMFEAIKPNPQTVADTVVNLIHTKDKRPLRTVVDTATGNLVEAANNHVLEQYAGFLTAFGMQGMLT